MEVSDLKEMQELSAEEILAVAGGANEGGDYANYDNDPEGQVGTGAVP